MDVKPASPAAEPGFGHSRRRLAVEVGLVIAGLVALVFGSFKVASCMAGTLVRFVPLSVDESLGESAWHQLAPDDQRCTSPVVVSYVEKLTAPLLAALDAEGYSFHFAVADSEDVNAYALPGGFVTINLGLLREAHSGEEIAGVLAHEIHHVTLRHGMTRIVRAAGGKILLGLILGWSDVGALAQYAGRLVDLEYDRDQERDADRRGRALLMRAGIDPGGLATFFARLAEGGGVAGAVPTILSTHPSHSERVRDSLADAHAFKATVTLPPPPSELPCR